MEHFFIDILDLVEGIRECLESVEKPKLSFWVIVANFIIWGLGTFFLVSYGCYVHDNIHKTFVSISQAKNGDGFNGMVKFPDIFSFSYTDGLGNHSSDLEILCGYTQSRGNSIIYVPPSSGVCNTSDFTIADNNITWNTTSRGYNFCSPNYDDSTCYLKWYFNIWTPDFNLTSALGSVEVKIRIDKSTSQKSPIFYTEELTMGKVVDLDLSSTMFHPAKTLKQNLFPYSPPDPVATIHYDVFKQDTTIIPNFPNATFAFDVDTDFTTIEEEQYVMTYIGVVGEFGGYIHLCEVLVVIIVGGRKLRTWGLHQRLTRNHVGEECRKRYYPEYAEAKKGEKNKTIPKESMPFTKISSELNITTLEEARDLLLKLQKRQQVFEEFLAEHYLYGGTVKAVFSPGEGLGSKQPARRSTSISPAPDNDRHNGWAA